MSNINTRSRALLGGALLTAFIAMPVLADDTEIYASKAEATNAKPNVLFILDTSGSMDTPVPTTPLYDPSVTYASQGCDPDRIYFSINDTPPACSTGNWFPRTSNHCRASQATLANIGGSGVWPALGNPRARAGQYRANKKQDAWQTISAGNSGQVECQDDDGIHGENGTTTNPYIKNNSTPPWGSSSSLAWSNIGSTYRFYTANYLNFKNGPGAVVSMTRLQIVRDVAISLATSLQNVNLGLMRYSSDAEGGFVLNAIENIDTNRANVLATLNTFTPTSGNGGTPLSETFYEAARYLKGLSVDYGDRSSPALSVDASRTSAGASTYKSPIEFQCQKNYIVYLTDGAPTSDHGANSKAATMMGQPACAADPIEPFHDGGWTLGSGICMDDLAKWMNTTDLSSSEPGDQTASTYMVGFGNSLAGTLGYLNNIAKEGGTGQAYTAADVPTLTDALQTIFSGIQEEASTFITPAVTVNAFNRAQTSDDLFFSLFKAAPRMHWPGNLKKYRLEGTDIVDANDKSAIDSNGFFASGSQSIWSPSVDGNDVTAGGAASQLPDAAKRNLYTYLSTSKTLSASGNALSTANTALTDQLVGAGSSTSACSQACKDAIDWARGVDVKDTDKDGDVSETIRYMGDPLHGKPGIVTYAGTTASPDATDTVVFVPTNDGFLHAIGGKTTGAGAGVELWAFMPPELLSRLNELLIDATVSPRTYGLDGDVQVLKFDRNQDGIVDGSAGDKVWLFFGMRMGGDHYYALDVTDRNDPQLMWSIGSTELPEVGQTWSPPVITRVKVDAGGSANTSPEKFVLIFGGGYDMGQETQPYSTDFVGNRIFMVDAQTGALLWYAGPGSPDLDLPQMTNSIPAKITVIDTNGDLFADRMYAGDMGGRLWRFDIFNEQPATALVTGGVIAKLGAGDNGSLPNSAARRFYNAPDVALIQRRGEDPYYNIAIGSGYRGHPLDEVTAERFYSIRDKQPFARLSQIDYGKLTPILDGDLVDITSDPMGTKVPAAAAGWKLALTLQPGRSGEKVLAEATTVNNVILFTTFQPVDSPASDPCFPANINRVYAITADSGKPALDFTDDGIVDNDDLSVDLNQQGIVGEVNVALIRPEDDPNDPNTPPGEPPTVCIAGVQILKKCVSVGGTVRTFWQRTDAQ